MHGLHKTKVQISNATDGILREGWTDSCELSYPLWDPEAVRLMMFERSVENRLFALLTSATVGRNLLFLLEEVKLSNRNGHR